MRRYCLVARLAALVVLTVFMLAETEAVQAIQPNASGAARLLDVPFVSQTEALCGGAAAAMVARYWGDRAVYAEDFAGVVDAEARGIRTDVLTEALVDRGWDAHAFRGTEHAVRRHLEQGRPVIVLVRESPDRYHYLVIVGWLDTQVIVHDPARAPFQAIDVTAFRRSWAAADDWTLLVLPHDAPSVQPPDAASNRAATNTYPTTGSDGPPACHGSVSQGIALANRGALGQAETILLAAMTRCSDAVAPVRELAGLRVRQGRWTEASQLARRALAREPADEHARRLLATSLFLQDDPSGALQAWNRLGEPVIDLIQVQGLTRTRHAVFERVLGFTPNTVLTTARLKQARRRLTLLPTPTSPRVGYRPRTGRAEVEVAVGERPVVALDTGHWVRAGMRAATDRTVRLDITSPTGNGEQWSASWRWWSPRPRLALFLDTPAPRPKLGSVWQIGMSWEQQTYGGAVPVAGRTIQDVSLVMETQQRVSLTVKDWAPTDVYWEATAAFDEWSVQGKYASLGFRVATHRFEEHFATGAAAHGWTGLDGGTPFATWALFSTWRSSTARTGLRLSVRGGVDTVTADAPRALWPGAGVGHARRALLRAHPLLDDGVIASDRLSRRLTSLTLEVEHAWRPRWPLQVGIVGFVDSARGWGHVTGERSARTHVDVGAGLRLGVPGQAGRLRIDLARGLQDGALAASLGWEPPWPH